MSSAPVAMTSAISALFLMVVIGGTLRAQTSTPPVQTPSTQPENSAQSGILKILLKLVDDKNKDKKILAGKHIFLSTKQVDSERIKGLGPMPSRNTFYEKPGVIASKELIKWLKNNYCDTVYCREIREDEVTCEVGKDKCVPEFVEAYKVGLKMFKENKDIARKWIPNNLAEKVRNENYKFYKEKMNWLDRAAKIAGEGIMLMTDRKGVAYLYNLKTGTYYLSSLGPIESEDTGVVWINCEVKVKPSEQGGSPPLQTLKYPDNKKNCATASGSSVIAAANDKTSSVP